jgi:hypothetical protein
MFNTEEFISQGSFSSAGFAFSMNENKEAIDLNSISQHPEELKQPSKMYANPPSDLGKTYLFLESEDSNFLKLESYEEIISRLILISQYFFNSYYQISWRTNSSRLEK